MNNILGCPKTHARESTIRFFEPEAAILSSLVKLPSNKSIATFTCHAQLLENLERNNKKDSSRVTFYSTASNYSHLKTITRTQLRQREKLF
ncbi:hypothetical protein PUN28_013440 [Cardiocondyla obscurior]|uniref:Uncharacterized protein n=1 Tax=Cardiocondyla obscurior TaxID=286306 RepID=A0AAW2F6A9_9HYME